MKKLLLIASVVLISLASFAQSRDSANVWSRVEALSKAVFETKDSIALNDLVSKRVTYGHSAGKIEDKATMVHAAATSKTTYKNSVLERISIDVDGNTALVRHNFSATSIENGTETPLNLSIMQVWRKEQ